MTSPAQARALTSAISPDRLGTYQAAAAASGADALDLYIWDRDLASAVLADIAILEVALRNAIHAQLSASFGGPDWYTRDIGLDDRSRRDLTTAWGRLKSPQRTPGKVVAQLMFGFWAGLLDAGGYVGRPPQDFKSDYEQLWRVALNRAFPGAKPEAAGEGVRASRSWVQTTVGIVHALRNRAAHHEPLVGGFPLPGQNRRLSASEGHDACLKLARIVDRDLGGWLGSASAVPALLARRPQSACRNGGVAAGNR